VTIKTTTEQIQHHLAMWGFDTHLGYMTDQTLRLSENGAENLLALIEKLTEEYGQACVRVGQAYAEGSNK
jgi:hypothetical protein